MLKVYKPINHKIFDAHKLIEYLITDVFCKADSQKCKTKLNDELKRIYDNPKSDWFKISINNIYKEAKKLKKDEKEALKLIFFTNNKIEDLCSVPQHRISLDSLNKDLIQVIVPFFKELYDRFLSLEYVYSKYGTKKEYYDALISHNELTSCPCCGYGQIKTIYHKGHSAFDHYLPLKHYPFSVLNFNNLFPLCSECNSDYKGDLDILKKGKKVFYPFNYNHPKIEVLITISLTNFVRSILDKDKLQNNTFSIDFSINSDEIDSWDDIFKIRDRYFSQIATHRISWLNDVREVIRDQSINADKYSDAFDKVIKSDANKHLGFLKSSFLTTMKSFPSLVEAMNEVSGNYKI